MGIDVFDALSGIGAGLSTLGQGMEQKRKEALAERLQKEEESRLEERQKRAEQRQHDEEAQKVKERTLTKAPDGTYKYEARNPFGGVISVEDANPLQVEEYNRAVEKDKASIDQVLASTDASRASAEQNRAETSYLPRKYSLDSRLTESQIAENNAQAARAARPDTRTSDTSLVTLTEEMADEMKAYQGQLSPELFRTAVREALKRARIEHTDAREVLLKFLPEYKKKYEGK